jgi:serine/threonine-protein kinase HipA
VTSKPAPTECFVYITLPGANEPVTAGRFELTTNRSGVPLGRFVCGKFYLERADAVPLDPFELKLSTRVYETTDMKGIFAALRDAGPDYWGRLVIDRRLGKAPLSELDYLLYSPDDRAGVGLWARTKASCPETRIQSDDQSCEIAGDSGCHRQ